MENLNTKNRIKTTIAKFNKFPPLEANKYTQNSVIYFWESHTKTQDKESISATSNFLHRIDLSSYEKYEVYTGYLSRWNYMYKNFDEMSKEEIEEAIHKGYEEQDIWLKECQPDLPNFMPIDWKNCIGEKKNPYYQQCKEMIVEELESNKIFFEAFSKSVNSYADRNKTSKKNGEQYVLEEISWIFSLPLLHLNKNIYLIHVGNYNPAIKEMLKPFPSLNKAVKCLSPRIKEMTFKNDIDFLMFYNVNSDIGSSYYLEKKDIKDIIESHFKFRKVEQDKSSFSPMEFKSRENVILEHIIEKLPCHIYWLNRDNVYLGCNIGQAKDFGLNSTNEIIGKTNFDFHDHDTAVKLNRINELIMSTGKPYEGEEPACVNGTIEKYLSTKIPLFDVQGKVVGILGVSFDITERKRAEELEKKLAIKKVIRNELYEIERMLVDDSCSPALALYMFHKLCKDRLCKEERNMLEMAMRRIREIPESFIARRGLNRNKEVNEGIRKMISI